MSQAQVAENVFLLVLLTTLLVLSTTLGGGFITGSLEFGN